MAKSATYEAIVAIGAKVDKTFGPAINSAKKGIGVLGNGMKIAGAAAVGVAAAVVAGAAAAVGSAGKMQAELSNIGTLLDGDVNARLAQMQHELLGVSNTTGMVTSDLTAGMYQVVSAFGDGADAAKQLEIAAIAAKAGNASTTDSINLLSAVTKGYNDTSLEAMQKASDLSFQTVKLGQTSFPELAASIGKVIPLANAMKGSQEDLFGAMATLTGVTGGTAEVATQLRGVYQGFLQPTASMTTAMQKLGYADGQVMMETLGLQGTLDALKGSVGGNELAFANLFGSIEAKNAVLALTGAQAESLTEKTMAMYSATGITNKAFAQQTANLPAVWAKMVNYGKNAITMLGTAMLPPLMGVMEKVMPIMESGLAKLPAIMEAIAPVVGKVFGYISDRMAFLAENVMPVVNSAFQVFSQKILPAVVPWVSKLFGMFSAGESKLLKFAGDILPKVGQTFQIVAERAIPAFINVFNKIGPVIAPVVNTIGSLVSKLMQMVNAVLPPVISALEVVGAAIVSLFAPVFPIIDSVLTALGGVMDFITGVFTGNWTMAWEGVKSVFGNIWEALVGIVKIPFNQIIGGINGVFASIGSFTVPDWVPVIGGSSITLPQIPMLYTGARNFPGGPAIVGERGPELVDLPRGANVFNNRETLDILARPREFGGGITIAFTVKNVIYGPITREQVREATTMTKQELKRMLSEICREDRRLAFSG